MIFYIHPHSVKFKENKAISKIVRFHLSRFVMNTGLVCRSQQWSCYYYDQFYWVVFYDVWSIKDNRTSSGVLHVLHITYSCCHFTSNNPWSVFSTNPPRWLAKSPQINILLCTRTMISLDVLLLEKNQCY